MTATGAAGRRVSLRQRPRPCPFRGELLRRMVRRAAARLSPGGFDVRVLVVEDREMAAFNRRFLGREGATNVIAFPEDPVPPFPAPVLAGDIVVSAPTCLAETRRWGGSPEERVLFFIVHGMVHLMGLDHERGPAEARRMRRLEEAVWRSTAGTPGGRGRAGDGAR